MPAGNAWQHVHACHLNLTYSFQSQTTDHIQGGLISRMNTDMAAADARIELLARLAELHAHLNVAKLQLEQIEKAIWNHFGLEPPQEGEKPAGKRAMSAEGAAAREQLVKRCKREKCESEETLILGAEDVTLTLKAESQPSD